MQGIVGDDVVSQLIQGLQQFQRFIGLGFGAVDLELLVAVSDLDAQRNFNGAQVRVRRSAEMGQA